MYCKENDYGVKYPNVKVDNFRDLGGIELSGGRIIKDGAIFRSGELFGLSEEEKSALEQLQIKHVFDLRSTDEVEYKPDYVAENCAYHNIPAVNTKRSMVVNPQRVADMIPSWLPASVSCWGYKLRFKNMYRKLPFNNRAYAEIFRVMDKGESLLFHCTAGKDRTGVASMLILFALGADLETVKKDYFLSNFYRTENNKAFFKEFEERKHYKKIKTVLEVAGNVHEEFFNQAYDSIISKYKTVNNFLNKEYGVTEERVKKWKEFYTR